MGNIFEMLAKELPEVERQTKGIRQLTEHAMTSRLLCLFFGWDWYASKIAFVENDPDEWMHNLKGEKNLNRALYARRVIGLGDAIFTLLKGKFKGSEILKQRFLARATKSCFIETEIASLLAYNGFDVEIVGETGVRGEDFDLAISRDGVTLSVEITGKEDGPITVHTISNTLKSKRTQVPPNRPAVLYMRIPAEWMELTRRGQAIFTEAFVDFFRRSHRFNAVVLVWEQLVSFGTGAFTQMNMWTCYNNHPRHFYPHMALLGLIAAPNGQTSFSYSFFDWLKGVEAKMLAKESEPLSR